MGTKDSENSKGKALSPVAKAVSSTGVLEHMGMLIRLRRDHLAALARRISGLRREMAIPRLKRVTLSAEEQLLKTDGQSLAYRTDDLLLTLDDVIVALRTYQKGTPPEKIPVGEGHRWVEHNRVAITERSKYIEQGGQKVTVGEKYATRKTHGKDGQPKADALRRSKDKLARSGADPVKTIMVRLMPQEARAVGDSALAGQLADSQLERAIDRTVSAFEKEIGCEVISAAVHRMRNTDLHIHIQYTMVLAFDRYEKLLKRAKTNWKTECMKQARAALTAEGGSLASPTIGKRFREMRDKGLFVTEPETVVAEKLFQKEAGARPLTNDSILGYGLKFKLNLVRQLDAALKSPGLDREALDDLENLRQRVIDYRDQNENCRFKAARSDKSLETQYLDVWLERKWRQHVVCELPALERDKLAAAGVEEARKYAKNGSTGDGEQSHLERHNTDVAQRLKEAEEAVKKTTEEIAQIEAKITEESERLQKLQDQVELERTSILEDLRGAWLEVVEAEDLAEIENPPDADPNSDPTVTGWMDRIKIAFGKKEATAGMRAELSAWKKVLGLLGKKEFGAGVTSDQLGIDAEKIVSDRVETSIAEGMAKSIATVFGFFGKPAPKATETPEAVNDALVVAVEEFKIGKEQEIIRAALTQVHAEELPEHGKMDLDGLRVALRTDVGLALHGVKKAIDGLVRRLIGNAAADEVRDPVYALEMRIKKGDEVARLARTLAWNIDEHASDLADSTRLACSELKKLLPEVKPATAKSDILQMPHKIVGKDSDPLV